MKMMMTKMEKMRMAKRFIEKNKLSIAKYVAKKVNKSIHKEEGL